MFFSRKKELAELREKLSGDQFESILIYGRRRVGKTALIREAAGTYHGCFLYYECKRSLFGDNLDGLNRLLRDGLGVRFSFQNFRDILFHLAEQAQKQPILFVLDEFPFLMTEKPSVISDIRDLIDQISHQINLKLILSGSYVDMMKSLIEGNSETFGRFTSVLELKAFDYYDAASFYSGFTPEEKMLMYSVFGGVAFFNSLIEPDRTPTENIQRLILRPNSILQMEIEYSISSETNKIPMMNSVIEAIGAGNTKYADIKKRVMNQKNGDANIDYLLKKLTDLEIVEKKVPINDPDNRKKTFYVLADNLMRFYYQFIFPNKNMNSIMNTEDFYNEFVKEKLMNRYLPTCFEKVTREYLIRANRKHLIDPVIYEVGTYSYDDPKKKVNRQFDIVTRDRNGYVSYECKYTAAPVPAAVYREEEYQIRESGIPVYALGFASKSGFDPDMKDLSDHLITLDDMYADCLA